MAFVIHAYLSPPYDRRRLFVQPSRRSPQLLVPLFRVAYILYHAIAAPHQPNLRKVFYGKGACVLWKGCHSFPRDLGAVDTAVRPGDTRTSVDEWPGRLLVDIQLVGVSALPGESPGAWFLWRG
jgi:hypothetical protein